MYSQRENNGNRDTRLKTIKKTFSHFKRDADPTCEDKGLQKWSKAEESQSCSCIHFQISCTKTPPQKSVFNYIEIVRSIKKNLYVEKSIFDIFYGFNLY